MDRQFPVNIGRLSGHIAMAAVCVLTMAGCGSRQESEPRPVASSNAGPVRRLTSPEMERARPWTPQPSSLPLGFVKAVQFALAHGLPDPREGQFGRAAILQGDPWHPFEPSYTGYGWEMKGSRGVSWFLGIDGGQYKGVPLDDPQSVGSVPLAMLSAAGAGVGWAPVDRNVLASDKFPDTEFAAALFLVAGRADVAERLLGSTKQGQERGILNVTQRVNFAQSMLASNKPDEASALLDLGQGVLRWKWHNAIAAHQAGDFQLALDQAAQALAYRGQYEDALRRLGKDPSGKFAFLKQAPDLVADSELRVKAPTDDLTRSVVRLTDESVEAVRYWAAGQRDADRLAAFVAGRSQRLSRSLKETRNGPGILTAREAAARRFAILTYMYVTLPSAEYTPSPAEVSVWWKLNRSISPAERVYRDLADDSATPHEWALAAGAICPVVTAISEEPVLDVLRQRAAPSVSELMAKRVFAIDKKLAAGNTSHFADAVSLCRALWRWDRRSSLAPIVGLTQAAWSRDRDWLHKNFQSEILALQLLEGRLALGDHSGLREYRDLLESWCLTGNFRDSASLGVYAAYRNAPEFKGFGREVFLDPVLSVQALQGTGRYPGMPPLNGLGIRELLKFPEEREALIRLLEDRTPMGDNQTPVPPQGGSSEVVLTVTGMPRVALPVGVRHCDFAMANFFGLPNVPFFSASFPEGQRDAIIAKTIALIRSGQLVKGDAGLATDAGAIGIDRKFPGATEPDRYPPRLGFPGSKDRRSPANLRAGP